MSEDFCKVWNGLEKTLEFKSRQRVFANYYVVFWGFFLQPPTTGGVRVCGGGALTHEGKRTIEFLFAQACTLLSKTLITSSLRPQQHDVSMCRLIMKPRKSNC